MGDRAEVAERGLLIGGKSVPATSGKLTDDLSRGTARSTHASPPERRRT
jgi:hypothetical protein